MVPYERILRWTIPSNVTVSYIESGSIDTNVVDYILYKNDNVANSGRWKMLITNNNATPQYLLARAPLNPLPSTSVFTVSGVHITTSSSVDNYSYILKFWITRADGTASVAIGLGTSSSIIYGVRLSASGLNFSVSPVGVSGSSVTRAFSQNRINEIEFRLNRADAAGNGRFEILFNQLQVYTQLGVNIAYPETSESLFLTTTGLSLVTTGRNIVIEIASGTSFVYIDYLRIVAGDELW